MDAILQVLHNPIVISSARAALAILFLIGGAQKLRDPIVFKGAIENYGVVPLQAVPIVAYLVPLLEVVAGALLMVPRFGGTGALGALVLLAVVTAGVTLSLLKGHVGVDCGCGGLSSQPLSWGLVMRNLALICIAALATTQEAARLLGWLDFFLIGVIALSLLGVYVLFNQLMSTAPLVLKTKNHYLGKSYE